MYRDLNDEMTHARTHARREPSPTKDTLNDLSSVILCNVGDVGGERLS